MKKVKKNEIVIKTDKDLGRALSLQKEIFVLSEKYAKEYSGLSEYDKFLVGVVIVEILSPLNDIGNISINGNKYMADGLIKATIESTTHSGS